jgi:hypothetical protein
VKKHRQFNNNRKAKKELAALLLKKNYNHSIIASPQASSKSHVFDAINLTLFNFIIFILIKITSRNLTYENKKKNALLFFNNNTFINYFNLYAH